MRERILALVDELKRRKADGDELVYVAPESIAALRTAVRAKQGAGAAQADAAPSRRLADAAPAIDRQAPAVLPVADEPAFEMKPYRKPAPAVVVEQAPALPEPPSFTVPEGDKRMRWEWLRDRVLNCPVCKANLNPGKQIVFGNGNIDADIFFCGEAPGADEETQGIPFVGKAGQLLIKIISAMGLSREQVYIGNIMNWRPQTGQATGNRPPTEEEMAFCLPYLMAQVEVVRPKVIVALGNTAVTGLMGPDKNRRLGKIRGQWFDFKGTPLMPTYHPSYVLQYGSNTVKRQIWEDMLTVMERVGLPISEKQQGYFR